MPIYRVIEPRLGRLRLSEWRRRARPLLALLALVILLCAVGLALLDTSDQPIYVKFLLGMWNALNLVTTLGDFENLDRYQKFFLMLVMVGVAVIGAYAVGQLSGMLSDPAVVALRENRSMEKRLQQLSGHVVVVGYDELGRQMARRLVERGRAVVVIDRDEASAALASERGFFVVKGDAGIDEGTLIAAGTERAAALIVATNDADRSLAITLMAHVGNPALHVIAFANDERRAELLRRAGAAQVVQVDALLADAMLNRMGADGG